MIPLTEEVSPDSALEDSMGEYNHFISDFSPSIDYRCVIFANTSVGPSPVSSATGRTFEESKCHHKSFDFMSLYMYSGNCI